MSVVAPNPLADSLAAGTRLEHPPFPLLVEGDE